MKVSERHRAILDLVRIVNQVSQRIVRDDNPAAGVGEQTNRSYWWGWGWFYRSHFERRGHSGRLAKCHA